MPGYNIWAPRTGMFGNQLSRVFHHGHQQKHAQAISTGTQIATAAAQKGIDASKKFLSNWNYPSEKILATSTMAKTRKGKSKTKRGRRRTHRRRKAATLQPNKIVRNLKSVFRGYLDCAAGGVIGTNTFQLNSAYDPTGAHGAGQPLGFDQYTALYAKYCVIGYKMKIELCSEDNTNSLSLGFTPKTESAALTNLEHYKECKATVSTLMTPDIDKSYLFHKGGIKKWFGKSKLLSDDKLNAAIGSNPTSILYGHLWAQALDAAADAAKVRFVVTMTQTIVFYEPIVPARS